MKYLKYVATCFAYSLNIFHIFRDTLLQIPSNTHIFPTIAFLPKNRMYIIHNLSNLSDQKTVSKKRKEKENDSRLLTRAAKRIEEETTAKYNIP